MMKKDNVIVPSLSRRKLTAFLGGIIVVVSALGLVWVFDGFSASRIIAENIPTISITADCRSIDDLWVIYKVRGVPDNPQLKLYIDLFEPKCGNLVVSVAEGDMKFKHHFVTAFPKKKLTAGEYKKVFDRKKDSTKSAYFNLSAYSDSQKVRLSISIPNVKRSLGSSLEKTDMIREKGFADYLIVGRTLMDIDNVKIKPTVRALFPYGLDVINQGASIIEEVPFSPSVGRSFLVQPANHIFALEPGYTGPAIGRKKVAQKNWYMRFGMVSRELLKKRDMLIILFSTLIGIGVSALLESVLASEIYRNLRLLPFVSNKNKE